jgi:ABC-type uncharacterized transport system involved in gliding motility auxiliary subunit
VASAPDARGQSLGEAAAKEKERRARTGGSAKTFTDADLEDAAAKRAKENPSPTPSGSPGASPSPSPSPGRGSSPAASPSPGAQDPNEAGAIVAAQKARGAEYKAQLDVANAQLKSAEEELALAEADWRMVNDHRMTLASRYDSARERFETATRNVDALRRRRDEIEDAARREGIPPGYYLR